ncbi:MAG: thioesterase family protein [Actinomycetales bacterium]|nr:thioesterase family protein [Actinomycetales bacterium]
MTDLPPYAVADLLPALELRETAVVRVSWTVEPTDADAEIGLPDRAARVFTGPSQKQRYERTFGGQLLAQAIIAAGHTVPGKVLHSTHTTFLLSGADTDDVHYIVEPLTDGRSFSTRRVSVVQHGLLLATVLASFQERSEGLDHAEPGPAAPPPEQLPNVAEALAGAPEPYAVVTVLDGPIELRHVEGHLYAGARPEQVARQGVWLRARRELPADPLVHAAYLAYASDYSILETVLRRHGTAWSDPRLRQASLDHTMWFHRPGRADRWVLHVGHSPSASGGRGLGLGRMYAADGTLLASIAQEGMLRLKQP